MRFNSFLRAVDYTSVKESAEVFGFALKEKQIEAVSSFVEAKIHLCLCQQVMASPYDMLCHST